MSSAKKQKAQVQTEVNDSEKECEKECKPLCLEQKEEKQQPGAVAEESKEESKEDFQVTAWDVKGQVDYEKLRNQFGLGEISQAMLSRFERVTGMKPHLLMRRGLAPFHRDFDKILDDYEQGKSIFLYTGRGPTTSSMHMGHWIPFTLTKFFQDAFQAIVVIQIADDEKVQFKKGTWEQIYPLGFENAKDIIAFGFDPNKTFIFSNRDYRKSCPEYVDFCSELDGFFTFHVLAKTFGFNDQSTVGQIAWPTYQIAASFRSAYPHIFSDLKEMIRCLVVLSLDQDVYFRPARDIAEKIKEHKPSTVEAIFLPALTGPKSKMSSSHGENTTIFFTDREEDVRKKVMKYALSGARGTGSLQDHKELGGDSSRDISYIYLRYLVEDDARLEEIRQQFEKGEMSCSQIKELMASEMVRVIQAHQRARAQVTDEILQNFYKKKPLQKRIVPATTTPTPTDLKDQSNPKRTQEEEKLHLYLSHHFIPPIPHPTIYHEQIETLEQGREIAKGLDGIPCKNLFLKTTSKKKQYYLLVTRPNEKTDLKKTGIKTIKNASHDEMDQFLHVPRGCVNPFALLNVSSFYDKSQLTVLVDSSLEHEKLCFHPLRTDATVTITHSDLMKFIHSLGIKSQDVTL